MHKYTCAYVCIFYYYINYFVLVLYVNLFVAETEVMKICDSIKSQSKSVVALGKKFFYQQLELDIQTAYK